MAWIWEEKEASAGYKGAGKSSHSFGCCPGGCGKRSTRLEAKPNPEPHLGSVSHRFSSCDLSSSAPRGKRSRFPIRSSRAREKQIISPRLPARQEEAAIQSIFSTSMPVSATASSFNLWLPCLDSWGLSERCKSTVSTCFLTVVRVESTQLRSHSFLCLCAVVGHSCRQLGLWLFSWATTSWLSTGVLCSFFFIQLRHPSVV